MKKLVRMSRMRAEMKRPVAVAALLGLGLVMAAHLDPARSEEAPELRSVIDQCAACHGKVGHSVSPDVPNLAGQSLEYMINQLQRFTGLARSDFVEDAVDPPVDRDPDQSRQRRSELMKQHASAIATDTLRDVAEYFSRLPCVQADKPQEPDATQSGIPWCADCHAPQKVQTIPSIPYIYGQNADYLEAQLLAFKRAYADRPQTHAEGRAHPSMDLFLRYIPDARLRDAAQYYARLDCSPR